MKGGVINNVNENIINNNERNMAMVMAMAQYHEKQWHNENMWKWNMKKSIIIMKEEMIIVKHHISKMK